MMMKRTQKMDAKKKHLKMVMVLMDRGATRRSQLAKEACIRMMRVEICNIYCLTCKVTSEEITSMANKII
jgi:hypothetical protein